MSTCDMDRNFSFRRAFLLLRNRILEELPALAIGLAVVAANNLISIVIAKRVWFNEGQPSYWWPFLIVCGGLLLAAQAFKGMHDGKAGTDWLLLPATPLEKYLSAAFDYLVVFPLAATALSMGLSAVFYLVAEAVGGNGGRIWSPADVGGFKAWAYYAIAASVCLAGSASFRKIPLLKTIAVASVYGLVMMGLIFLAAWIAFRSRGSVSFMNGEIKMNGTVIGGPAGDTIGWIYKVAGYALLPAFSLVYGYFRVFEKEARDEVQ